LARFLFSSLRSRLLALLAVAVLPGLGLQAYTAERHRTWAVQESQFHAIQLARNIADEQSRITEGAAGVLAALSMNPELAVGGTARCARLLSDFLVRHPRYTSFALYSPAGEPICSVPAGGGHPQYNLVTPALTRAVRTGELSLGDYGTIGGSLKPGVALAQPVPVPGSSAPRLLVATLELELFGGFSRDLTVPAHSALLVLTADGTVLSRHPEPERWVGRRVPDFDATHALIAADPGVMRRLNGFDGIERLYSFRALPSNVDGTAYVAVGVPTTAAHNPEDRVLARNAAVLMIFAILALALGWGVGTRFIIQPVHSLLGATRRLTRGELSARATASHAEGELSELAVSFNEMADSLQDRTCEMRRTLTALRRSEQRYRSLVEASAAIVWHAGPEGGFTVDQPGWSAFTGHSEAELHGWRWLSAVHPEDRDTVSSAWRGALERRTLFQVEHRLRRWDGEHRNMVMRALPLVGEDGEPREWIGVHLDVTSRKRAEAEKLALLAREREAREEAEAANRSKSDFLAVVSHELRTPLTSIISYAELMESDVRGTLCPRHREFVGRIESSAWHLAGLVEQILEFTRLEAGRVKVQLGMRDICDVVHDVVAEMQPLANAKGITLRTEIPGGPLVLRTDDGKLHQILSNLVSNALKFTDSGEVVLEVTSSVQDARIRVHDTGCGIAPEHLGRIWDTFWQAENPLTRKAGGTGLGLTIVRRLALLIGGQVTVASVPGQGSTFTVVLPQVLQHEVFDAPRPLAAASR
jgi:PAS domain S-box-containing protein